MQCEERRVQFPRAVSSEDVPKDDYLGECNANVTNVCYAALLHRWVCSLAEMGCSPPHNIVELKSVEHDMLSRQLESSLWPFGRPSADGWAPPNTTEHSTGQRLAQRGLQHLRGT